MRMDPLTHGLTGYVIASAFRKKDTPLFSPQLLSAVTCSVVPDLDFITRIHSIEFFLRYHRGLTHSILVAPLIVLICCAVIKRFWPAMNMRQALALGLLGVFSHIFLDVITSYGTRVFYPLNNLAVAWDWCTIIDPYLLLTLIVGSVLCYTSRSHSTRLACLTLIICTCFLCFKGAVHASVASRLYNAMVDLKPSRVSYFPNFLAPFNWRVVSELDHEFRYGSFNLLTSQLTWIKSLPKMKIPLKQTSLEHPSVRELVSFSRFPYARQIDERTLEWRDLRYYRGRDSGFFTMRVYFNKEGHPSSFSYNF